MKDFSLHFVRQRLKRKKKTGIYWNQNDVGLKANAFSIYRIRYISVIDIYTSMLYIYTSVVAVKNENGGGRRSCMKRRDHYSRWWTRWYLAGAEISARYRSMGPWLLPTAPRPAELISFWFLLCLYTHTHIGLACVYIRTQRGLHFARAVTSRSPQQVHFCITNTMDVVRPHAKKGGGEVSWSLTLDYCRRCQIQRTRDYKPLEKGEKNKLKEIKIEIKGIYERQDKRQQGHFLCG